MTKVRVRERVRVRNEIWCPSPLSKTRPCSCRWHGECVSRVRVMSPVLNERLIFMMALAPSLGKWTESKKKQHCELLIRSKYAMTMWAGGLLPHMWFWGARSLGFPQEKFMPQFPFIPTINSRGGWCSKAPQNTQCTHAKKIKRTHALKCMYHVKSPECALLQWSLLKMFHPLR